MSDQHARDAALSIDRHLLLQAPAGSGKTTVLAQRFLSALAGVDEPEEVLAITFTRKAAAEMRERVLLALEGTLEAGPAELARWAALRAAVLEQAARRGWQRAELPARLRIQTIDSLCHEIARAMPLLGRMQQQLQVVDDAGPALRDAALQALRLADAEPELQEDADRLLQRLENDWERACDLLAELLKTRNRWLPVLLRTPPDALGARVQASLERIAREHLRDLSSALEPGLAREALELVRVSAANLQVSLPEEDGHLVVWQSIARMALTGEGQWRKQITVTQGFPRPDKPLKDRWTEWMAAMRETGSMLSRLRGLLSLPPPVIDADERAALASLSRLMLLCAQQLKLVFRQRGQVDHGEVAAVARQALQHMGTPTELSVRQTLRVRHVLVDEFQDTSPDQLDLVEALTWGWDDDGRSLFLVGDPMQSIYLFRNSEVGLFLRTRAEGVGNIRLESLQLARNFRSVPPLVEWANAAFERIFPDVEDLRSSAVRFLRAQAARSAEGAAADAVTVWPQPDDDPQPEAAQIATEILRLRQLQPGCRIAVLVQTRAVAPPVLAALERAGVPALGVELASLSERPVVRDLIAIGQALLDGADRTAWLAMLHMPACGLSLADLQGICGDDTTTPMAWLLPAALEQAGLAADVRQRLGRIVPLVLDAWEGRGRVDLATAVESLWRRLGGWHACRTAAERAAGLQYLAALRRACDAEGLLDGVRLQALADTLRDAGASTGDNPVEILTIHHSKGLEWDVVFVPRLGKASRPDTTPLLQWLELPAPGGDTDLLLSVKSLREGGASDALTGYIAGLKQGRQDNERVRLVYVAVTRARHRLYLSGHAPWKPKPGVREPRGRSLLQVLWPALQDGFDALPAPDSEVAPERPRRTDLESPWHPLQADFVAPRQREPLAASSLSGGERDAVARPEYDWVGPAARAVGTLVHGELEQYALTGLPPAASIAARTGDFVSRLREMGMDPAQSRRLAADIVERLRAMLEDPRARWLFDPAHPHARSEWRLSGVVEGQLRNAVIDRSFVSDGCRWVVDFKTSTHAGAGLEEFLQSEVERYRAQLALYRTLAARTGPEPVRAALYFPWLKEFREVG